MYRKLMFLISLVMLLALANGAFASEFVGPGDQFCDPANWDPIGVPGPGDNVEIGDYEVVVDCDVTAGKLKGPGWDTSDYGSLTVNADKTISFSGSERHESYSNWEFFIAGSLSMDGNWRFADEATPTWNISGAGASLVMNGELRAGDNGGTGWNVNIDSGVLVFAKKVEIGDDGGGIWNLSGTGSVSFLDEFTPHLRSGSAEFELNISGNAELAVATDLKTNDKDGGNGTANINVNGGTISIVKNLELGDNGPGNLNVTAGLLVVGDTLKLKKGIADLSGGVLQVGDLDIGGDGVIEIQEPNVASAVVGGTLILDGNKLALIGTLVGDGKLKAMPCDSARGIVADYGITNPGKTTVTACCECIDVCQAWNPFPPSGAIEVESAIKHVVLKWDEGECLGVRGSNALYFGTDEDCVTNGDDMSPCFVGDLRFYGNPAVYDVNELPLWTTHYWRVDSINSVGGKPPETKGKIWNFTTGCDDPGGDINMDCLINFLDYAELAETIGEEEMWPE